MFLDWGKIKKRGSFCYSDLVSTFPPHSLAILDLGAGPNPFKARDIDKKISIDFDASTDQTITCDFTKEWPLAENEIDFAYCSHVIEHLYPTDRDRVVRNLAASLKPGGRILIRVPHQSSLQATGWEHFSLFGINGADSLTHGHNPNIPYLKMVAKGYFFSGIGRFYENKGAIQTTIEALLHISDRFTEAYLARVLGGIPEVQFLLEKPEP